MRLSAEKEVASLPGAIIDVIEWRPSAEAPKKGEALIQLFELPNDNFVDEAPKNERPGDQSGLPGPSNWLRDEDSNLGPGD